MKSGTLNAIRYALNRKIKSSFNLNITNSHSIPKSCAIFHALLADLKRDGLGSVKHYNGISNNDVMKILLTLKKQCTAMYYNK